MSGVARAVVEVTEAAGIEQGLTGEEYRRIVELLGRVPTFEELAFFGVMWSEHCSYKSSKAFLRESPTSGPQVLQGPGENAGAVDIGGEATFPDLAVGLVHGRLKPDEKAQVMADFKARRVQLLVATTVIEVGVDVPNATLMVIEHAERMGLAQLHQLRGRVGRGTARSLAILLYHQPLSEMARARCSASACETPRPISPARGSCPGVRAARSASRRAIGCMAAGQSTRPCRVRRGG